ncbi:hypothetical protein [Absidia glauca]|uniref:Arrestin C-terminal-like domain-containing protein n=1 Tax=Absidia glauca TaxID=4829 RepID=A0A163KKG5_ABSGL|nr:hypothetical protein [Absidia glauca]
MASVIRGRHQQLFGTQLTLWESPGEDTNTEPNDHYRFTLQMPMIQHPPSLDYGRLRYRCRFKLTAILDHRRRSSLQPLLTAHHTVYYRPWIPTRTLKVPVIRHSKNLVVQMAQSDIVAGERCQLQVSPSSSIKVVLELVQIVTLPFQMNDERIPPSETVVVRSAPFDVVPNQTNVPLSIVIPADTPPTYCFGRVITLRYELALQVCLKKKSRVSWPGSCFAEDNQVRLPLVIGTLGHGIRVPEDMKHYTDFGSFDTSSVPVPKFLPCIEYENTPPRYLPSTLPPYPSCIST